MRKQLPVARGTRWVMGALALAASIAVAQPETPLPGTLTIERWSKSDSLTAPRWPRLRCVNGPSRAFALRASEALDCTPWPTRSILTSDNATMLWTDESPGLSAGYYVIVAEEPLGGATNLQRILEQGRTQLGARGAGAAVISSKGTLWSGVSGFDVRTNILHPQLRFGFASVSKTFTGALILRAAEEGKLSLGDPLSRFSLDLPNITKTITLRQLLNHTSGLAHLEENADFINALLDDMDRWWTPSNALRYALAPRADPGQTFCYSGSTGFNVLGVVLEKVHGTNLAVLLEQALLRPYGLIQIHPYSNRAWTTVLGGTERAHGYAEDGSDYYNMSFVAYLSAISPSAGMYGTAEGLVRWGRLLYGGTFLGADSLASMIQETPGSQDAVKLDGALFADAYGLATCIYKTSHGAVFYGHAGQAIGYRVFFGHAPAINTSVVVWINRDVTLDRVLNRLFRPMLEAVQDLKSL